MSKKPTGYFGSHTYEILTFFTDNVSNLSIAVCPIKSTTERRTEVIWSCWLSLILPKGHPLVVL
jgi:hypothetical protein